MEKTNTLTSKSTNMLCFAWNNLTAPYKARTDAQHNAANVAARRVMSELHKRGHVMFWDSGAIRGVFTKPNAREFTSPLASW